MHILRWVKVSALVAMLGLLTGLALPAAAVANATGSNACCRLGSGPPAASPAFPVFVHLPADQAGHPQATFEWWYTVGHLVAGGHRFGYEVTLTESAGTPETHIAITDQTSGRYYQQVTPYQASQVSISTTGLDVRMPNATLSGPMGDMTLTATLPGGALSLRLRDTGPALYPGGTGLIPFLGGTSYYYSLPSLATSGTLMLAGRHYQVNGQSWLDRQWGSWDWASLDRWTWMAVQLSNGTRLNLWDLYSAAGENPYATVLFPDGHQDIVAITPVARDASGVWISPVTGQHYPTQWTVRIPALRAGFTVQATPPGQEVLASYPGITPSLFEGAATVTGTWAGQPVSGASYVEQLGHWQ